MRRRTKPVLASLLAGTVFAGSVLMPAALASAAPRQDPITEVSCGTVGPPVCDVVAQVTALLAPLKPVLDLAAPALGDLGASTSVLTDLLEGGPAIPLPELAAAAGDVLDELGVLTKPLLGLLKSAGIDASLLQSALSDLQSAAQTELARLAEPAAGPSKSVKGSSGPATPVAPAPAPAVEPEPVASSGFGGSVFSSGGALPESRTSGSALPDVPPPGTLDLAPLALPSFGISTGSTHTLDRQADTVLDDIVAPVVDAASTSAALPDDSRATAVVLAICMLMLAAGLLIDQARKARTPIRIKP